MRVMRRQVVPVDQQLNNLMQQQIARNSVALRGRRDDDPGNSSLQGNFQALLEFRIESGDQTLLQHLKTAPRNVTYISKTIQNEIITTVGKCTLSNLSREISESKYFSVMADEAADISNKENLAVVNVNVYAILQVLITIPITSASCERSISTLRNLKNYLRNTMVQDRLNGLALMLAQRDMELDLEKIIDLFANLHPRRMKMENMLQA